MKIEIKDEYDILRVFIATLTKVYSVTLLPRILCNAKVEFFDNNFSNFADYQIANENNQTKFAEFVHKKDFDIGLFFCYKNKKFILIVFDGNGYLASDFTKNIFAKLFFCKNEDLQLELEKIKKLYKKLNRKKLLIE